MVRHTGAAQELWAMGARSCGVWTLCLIGLVLPLLEGCDTSALIFWSPDGQRAVYYASKAGDHQAILIDEHGQQLMALGATEAGAFAWSADSSTLYLVRSGHAGDAPELAIDRSWVERGESSSSAASTLPAATVPATSAGASTAPDGTADDDSEAEIAVISSVRDGVIRPLASLPPGWSATYMILSPDQQWLAMVIAQHPSESEVTYDVYAHRLGSNTLQLVAQKTGFALCFTGPHRLAYLQTDGSLGRIRELVLDPSPARPTTDDLLWVLPTQWMQAVGDGDVLFTSIGMTFPAVPVPEHESLYTLYYFSRANRSIAPVAEHVEDLFAVSPDGKRILFGNNVHGSDGVARTQLSVANVNGSDPHALREIDQQPLPMYPAWRGNDQITFIDPEGTPTTQPAGGRRYEVVQYRLTPEGTLEPIATLSTTWEQRLKPLEAPPPIASTTQAARP